MKKGDRIYVYDVTAGTEVSATVIGFSEKNEERTVLFDIDPACYQAAGLPDWMPTTSWKYESELKGENHEGFA